MNAARSVLLLSAFGPEARPFRDGALDAIADTVHVEEVGVGILASAVRATRLLLEKRPSLVIFAGTAGAYAGGDFAIGDVCVATRAVLVDVGALLASSHVPAIYAARSIECGGAAVDAMTSVGAKPAHVGTTLSVTTDDALAERISRKCSVAVEHLEAQSIAAAAADAGTPVAIVLGIANRVGRSSHAEWKANHVAVSALVGALVIRALESGQLFER